ncbi:MAG: hypothetical protein HQ546_04600, partial [Planctomycetes bacterium]|nr:hypothetical protein [Planctomycetota bacterium]
MFGMQGDNRRRCKVQCFVVAAFIAAAGHAWAQLIKPLAQTRRTPTVQVFEAASPAVVNI